MDQQISDRNPSESTAGTGEADASRLMDETRHHLRDLADRQKSAVAEQVRSFARAVHKAADDLQDGSPAAAGYVHEAAARLDRFSSAMRERSLDDLMGQVRDFARAQPAVFFGGALIAGFALSRFLKSSADDVSPRRS